MIYVKPDSGLTIDMPECLLSGKTWGDLAEAYVECKSIVKEGNARFKAIRTTGE